MNKKESIIMTKSFDFALQIVQLYKELTYSKKEYVLSKQLLRSGTAIGALIREAEQAQSKKDFIHKLSISLKEANESQYWLLILKHSDFINQEDWDKVNFINIELLRLLTAIIKTTKRNLRNS